MAITLNQIDEIDEVATWAKYLKVSDRTAYTFVKSGIWPSFKFGRFIRIRKSEMLQRIEEMERNPEMIGELKDRYSKYWREKAVIS